MDYSVAIVFNCHFPMSDITISNKPERHRYEALSGATLAAYCEYNLVGDAVMFTHTEVLPAFEGQGIGSKLAKHVLDDVRSQNKHVIPVCQFIAGYLRKHREYVDLVRPDIQRAFKI
jgi:predicted GNAT family acetyltransferase